MTSIEKLEKIDKSEEDMKRTSKRPFLSSVEVYGRVYKVKSLLSPLGWAPTASAAEGMIFYMTMNSAFECALVITVSIAHMIAGVVNTHRLSLTPRPDQRMSHLGVDVQRTIDPLSLAFLTTA